MALRSAAAFSFSSGTCFRCGKRTFSLSVCEECRKRLFSFIKTVRPRCSACGRLLSGETDLCTGCRQERILKDTDGCLPLFPYRLWFRHSLFLWKMKQDRSFSRLYASCLNEALSLSPFGGRPVIVPVPPRPGKIRKRGWDQVQDLCSQLSVRYGYIVLNLLKRTSDREQKKLDRRGRLESAGKGYSLDRKKASACKTRPEAVLLIDDVMTTGSTLEACSGVLKSWGIAKVYAMTLFVVD